MLRTHLLSCSQHIQNCREHSWLLARRNCRKMSCFLCDTVKQKTIEVILTKPKTMLPTTTVSSVISTRQDVRRVWSIGFSSEDNPELQTAYFSNTCMVVSNIRLQKSPLFWLNFNPPLSHRQTNNVKSRVIFAMICECVLSNLENDSTFPKFC